MLAQEGDAAHEIAADGVQTVEAGSIKMCNGPRRGGALLVENSSDQKANVVVNRA